MKQLARICLISVLAFGSAAGSRGDLVTDWDSVLLQAIKNESTSPPLAARNLAILHISIYEAINAIEHKYEPYFLPLSAAAGAAPEAAAVGFVSPMFAGPPKTEDRHTRGHLDFCGQNRGPNSWHRLC